MIQVWPFSHVNQSQNSYSLTNSLPPPLHIDNTSRKSHFQEIMSSFFPNFNSIHFCLLIMFYAIYAGKFSLSSTNATKIYINLKIPEVAEIIDKCIFLKLLITKKIMINIIYYLTKYHLYNIFFKKNSIIRTVKNMILFKKEKIHAKQFS